MVVGRARAHDTQRVGGRVMDGVEVGCQTEVQAKRG